MVEFDPSGDLTQTAANSGIGLVKPSAITNAKLNPGSNSTLKGTSTTGVVSDIVLGPSMSMTAPNVLNSQISFFNGTDPNSTAPTDRPATTNVLYYGTNGSIWYYNGSTYVTTLCLELQMREH